jgi:hypothetical protein
LADDEGKKWKSKKKIKTNFATPTLSPYVFFFLLLLLFESNCFTWVISVIMAFETLETIIDSF